MGSRAVDGALDERTASTPWAWLLALAPLVSGAALQPVLIGFQQAAAGARGGRAPTPAIALVTAGFAIDMSATVMLILISGLLARLDQRRLHRSGIDRPFPWGWGFVYGIYLIGRTVVLRRRTGRGAAPLILAASLLTATMLALFIEFGVVFATVLQHEAMRR